MNYQKIYDDLIESRKVLPKLLHVYYERHHIVPKCLGGSDSVDNLVYLNYEDHFMAHLLLAKANKNNFKLWSAANAMMQCPPGTRRKVLNRHSAAIIRKNISGHNSPYADKTVHKFLNLRTNEEFGCTQLQLKEHLKTTSMRTCALVKGYVYILYDICLSGNTYAIELYNKRNKLHELIVVKTGEKLFLTRSQLIKNYKLSSSDVSLLLSEGTKHKIIKGFALPSTDISKTTTKYTIENIKSKDTVYGTVSEINKVGVISKSEMSKLLSVEGSTAQGWRLLRK